jgi:S1-C subfamily serine protease
MKINHFRKKYISILFLIGLLIIPVVSFADGARIFAENSRAVVLITQYNKFGEGLGHGSGFIVRRDGVIVTNYHVIEGALADTGMIRVTTEDERVFDVTGVIHIDKWNDIAILKVSARGLPVVRLGDDRRLKVGEKLFVIGSPKDPGLKNTITSGVLSQIRRDFGGVEGRIHEKVLQTDAAINQGNSSGPVFNEAGEVIGIATFGIARHVVTPDATVEVVTIGLNFAVPVNLIKNEIDGKVTALEDFLIKYRWEIDRHREKDYKKDYTKTADYWFNRGVVYANAGMYDNAWDALSYVTAINPYDAEAHFYLGLIALKGYGDVDVAFEQYKILRTLNPELANELFNLIYR